MMTIQQTNNPNRLVLLGLLCYSSFFLFCDQNALAPNLSQIAEEFGFDAVTKDQKLGADLAIGFFVVGAPAALLVGYLVDVSHRVRLAVLVFGVSALACLATYFTTNYTQLYIARVVTGIGIGGSQPLVYSLLADLFSSRQRTLANTLVGVAASTGVAFGQLLAGEVGTAERMGWRAPFAIMALPALLGVVLMLVLGKEPVRGGGEDEFVRLSTASAAGLDESTSPLLADLEAASDAAAAAKRRSRILSVNNTTNNNNSPGLMYEETPTSGKVLGLFGTKTVLLVFLQGFPGCLPWGLVGVFLNDYLSGRGLSVHSATAVLTCFNVGSILGGVAGGMWGQALFNKAPRRQTWLMSLSTLAAIPPLLFLINVSIDATTSVAVLSIVAFIGGAVASLTGPNVRSVLQSVITPELRGSAFAIFTICDDLGRAGGPALIVLLIDRLGRQAAFNLNVCGWGVCAFLLFIASFTYEGDIAAVQGKVRAALLREQGEGQTARHERRSSSRDSLESPLLGASSHREE